MLFFDHHNNITLSPDIRVSRAGSQLKTPAITKFTVEKAGQARRVGLFQIWGLYRRQEAAEYRDSTFKIH